MKIKVNEKEIEVSTLLSTTIRRNGKNYPALKFFFDGELTAENIELLTSGNILIGDNLHEGYTTLGEISLIVGKITTAEEERDAIQAEHEELKENIEIILPKLDDETALTVKQLFPKWEIDTAYQEGERVIYKDTLYKVVQGHFSQDGWTPDITASLYDAITITESGYDAWAQPTGTHDAYNIGDIVEYNGVLYKSLIDGNTYAPDTYPAGWEVYTEL